MFIILEFQLKLLTSFYRKHWYVILSEVKKAAKKIDSEGQTKQSIGGRNDIGMERFEPS